MALRRILPTLDPDRRAFFAGYAVLLPLFLTPLWVTPVLPFLDAPFHLAMADMLAKGSGAASPYAGYYEPRFWPPPPALPWVALAALGKVVTLTTALRVLVAAYVAGLPLAVAALARRLGGATTPALLAFPVAYNMALHYGFLGYAFSLPILFATLACTAAQLAAAEGTPPARGAVVLSGCACALFACHIETYGVGVVAILAMAATARVPSSRRRLTTLALLPSALLAAAWNAGTPYLRGVTTGRSLANALSTMLAVRRSELGGRSLLGDVWGRLDGLPHHLLRGFHDGSDRVASLVLLALLALLALACALRSTAGHVRAPAGHALARCRPALPAIALAGYLLLPHHFDEYEAMSVAPRLAPLVVLAFIASLPVATDAMIAGPLRAGRALYYAFVALGVVYGAVLGREYRSFAREMSDFESVVQRLPSGGRVVGLVYDGNSKVMNVESVLRGLPSLYVAMKPGPGGMVALRYCGMRHFPCAPGPRAAEVPAPDPWTPEGFPVKRGLAFFDYVLVRSGPAPGVLFGDAPVEAIAQSGTWTAYAPARPR